MSDHHSYTPGYRLDSAIVLRDLHLLLCVLLSIGAIRNNCRDDRDPLALLHARFGEGELQHLLISTAIMNRAQMDHMRHLRGNPDELSFPPLSATCGGLWEPETGPEAALTLREACNKIVHAEEIALVSDSPPRFQLHGRNRGARWVAVIDAMDYVRGSMSNFDDALA